MTTDPYFVYLLDLSYFSGKLEAYLRYKNIPYRRIETTWRRMGREVLPHTGLMKVPVVLTPQDQWLQDTTPMIDWFEERYSLGAVLPPDPYQAFFCRLLEDYADEWLWRPALHYRWSYTADARLLSRRIAEESLYDTPAPGFVLRWMLRRRQMREYVRGDGVTQRTRAHVETVYFNTLDRLERLLADRPFLLGGRPCLADFGFFASMFRHFSLDPTPSRIMREMAPGVYAWVARMWNADCLETADDDSGWPAAGTIPGQWQEFLADMATGYLEYLDANALAWRDGKRRMDVTLQGVDYRRLPVVHYRVWCRERLQQHLAALPAEAGQAVRATMEEWGALEPLMRSGEIASHLHDGAEPPLCVAPEKTRFLERYAVYWPGWNKAGRG